MWRVVISGFSLIYLPSSIFSENNPNIRAISDDIVLPTVDINAVLKERLAAKEIHHLFCYQCTGDNRDQIPICDELFWAQTNEDEKRQFLVDCPEQRNSYCIKKVVRSPIYVHTSRGCNGPQDDMGLPLRTGCSSYGSLISSTICVCKENECNSANSVMTNINILALLMSTLTRMHFLNLL